MISTFVHAMYKSAKVENEDHGVLTGQPQTSDCSINAKPVALLVGK